MKYDIFISYRRDGGEYTAKILRDRLEKLGYKVFFDVESLRSGDFNTKLYSVIDECTDFLLILSPNALDRCVNQDDWVRCEVEHALQKEKNIVPVMLRGFSFPEALPDSINPIRYKNGLEANTQFFDAFIDRLQEFLQTKIPMTKSLMFKRALTAVISLAAAALVGVGLFSLFGAHEFPSTDEEKSVTSEVIYYIENHLTYLDIMAGALDDALRAARQYVSSGYEDDVSVQLNINIAHNTLESCNMDAYAPDDGFIGRVSALSGTPFPVADLIAMHDVVSSFQEEWAVIIENIQWTISYDTFLSNDTRLSILDGYRTVLEESLRENAYLSNELLISVTEQSALSEFLNVYLPGCKLIPLSADSWSTDTDVLESAVNACMERVDSEQKEILVLMGNISVNNDALKKKLIRECISIGMSQEEAESYVDERLQLMYQEVYSQYHPEEGDDEDTLWMNLAQLMGDGYYTAALQCVEALEELADPSDTYAAAYLPALRSFVAAAVSGVTGIDYGVMVTGWAEPDTPHEVYQIGDIIISFNSQVCHTYEEYAAFRSALTGDAFKVSVLRFDEFDMPVLVNLELNMNMPPVYLRTLSDYMYDTFGE